MTLKATRISPNTVNESLFARNHMKFTFRINTDELMNKLYNSIASKRENVIAIYTARHPSFVSEIFAIFDLFSGRIQVNWSSVTQFS